MTEQQKQRVQFVYDEYADMTKKRQETYPQFNDRTLIDFVDDCDKRTNAYVLPRSSQGKEDWQANFATRSYANKTKALLAATARDIPDMKFDAVDKEDLSDFLAADITKNLVRHSYQKGNPTVDLFYLGWSLVTKGTVLSYEGFQQHKFKKKKIKSFDLLTGDVEYDEVEETSYAEPVSFEIPLQNVLIKNFYISDIQQQPGIIWWTYYTDRDRFDFEWGKYPNAKDVKDFKDIPIEEQDTYFCKTWKQEIKNGQGYLLLRYMNVYTDTYRVVCNGIELYNGPMLWEDISCKGLKRYPIAKEIFEPFAQGQYFFYGNSMVNAGMGEGDVMNTLINSALDKTYRSMVPPLLIGMVNKDMLDLEDEVVAGDTKIYVDDVSQVKQMEIKGITDSDIAMINLIGAGFNMTTLDPSQQGSAEKYVTARAAVAADERARQLKGLFFSQLENLWLQKVKLRVPNIFLSYTKPQIQKIVGEKGAETIVEKFRTITVKDTKLSDGTRGNLAVQFYSGEEDKDKLRLGVEGAENNQKSQGFNYERLAVKYDYLDSFSFDIQIIPASLWSTSQALAMAMSLEKVQLIANLFREYFDANKELFFREILERYDDTPDKYQFPQPMMQQQQMMQEAQAKALGAGGAESGGGSAGGGLVSDLTGNGTNQGSGPGLGKLSGVQI